MYKLLLVDDDTVLLESFYEFIDWNKFGFEVVARLGNGREALEYVKNAHVDVVVTDIKMPEMDGIELAGKLYESYPDIKIVFVSAFCDFGYARQAIKYKVADYISKPILREEVEEILNKLHMSLKMSDNNDQFAASKVIAERHKIFSELLGGVMTDIEIYKEELAGVQIPYNTFYSKCAVAIFEIMGMERQLEEAWKRNREKLSEAIINSVCNDTIGHYVVLLDFSDNMLALLYLNKGDTPINPKKCIDDVTDDLLTMYKLMAVNEAFLEYASFEEFKADMVSARTTEMKYLKNKIELHSDDRMIYEVEKYVNTHYREDITIGAIADRYHFNERYFREIFKKAKGNSFFNYLNEVRIEKAKEMLKKDESIEAVSKQAGFGSRRNFDRQFLEYTGETPAQYRKNQMRRKK